MAMDRSVQIESRIRRASDRLVFQFGARGWNMDDCAAEAGITKRTLYRYRDNRAQVVEEVLLRFIRDVQENLMTIIGDSPDFQVGITRLSAAFPELLGRLNTRQIHNIYRQYPELEGKVIQQRRSLTREITDYVRRAQEEGKVRRGIEPQQVVDLVQALVLFYMKQDTQDLERNLKQGLSVLLHGFLPEQAS